MASTQESAPTIRDALVWANEEDDPTSIQPIIDILYQQGWEVDKQKAGRLFCSLDPFSSAYASLNDRQQTVLKLAIQGAKTGFATNATAPASTVLPAQSSALPPEDLPAVLTKEQLEQTLEEKLEVRDKKMLAAMQGMLAQRNQTDWSVLRHRWTALTTAVPPGKKVL
ncbi:hypothetical protein HYH02_004871 [Chlamydomonas schloesseri]|uniref:Uncharacterized protein n=1 Tax=Chlamydomonas schloesseri TaxID=2026947 RepID=A0A836B7X8_9CHLO|nr:hypothetical protein HYH02_004871 [Chlamydomonas schloesseri]|eukprot:KAG2450366.1 hypothetical protein HYH02_004871 [Chlamydomonas schloesseri]